MQYNKFGNIDFQTSILGFGCMRLPVLNKDQANIDEVEAIRMIRYAIDNGVNYVDTAFFYHSGQSEIVVGKALQNGYREKVKLATKLPIGQCNKFEDFDSILNKQLKRLDTDHIDFYLLHGINQVTWDKGKKLGVEQFLENALADGRIKYVGFSFHDELAVFKEIVDAYPWTFCQIQYNYMDTEFQAGTEGLQYAADKGLAVIIMEPIKGGKLARTPPPSVLEIWSKAQEQRSTAEWALRWVWNHPEVTMLLSGMTTMNHVEENLRVANVAKSNSLSEQEIILFDEVKKQYRLFSKIDCTACGYCQPCPSGVDIPRNFSLYNDTFIYNDSIKATSIMYNFYLNSKTKASACTECGACEEACPQQLKIRDHLKEIQKTFES